MCTLVSSCPRRSSPPLRITQQTRTLTLNDTTAGTRLTNLNHIKNGADPIALPDLEYPAWLWTLTSTTPTAASSSSSTANKKTSASGSGSSTTTTKSEKKEKVEMKRTNKVAIKARNSLKG